MSESKRAALYMRISTDEANQPWSLGAQRDRLTAYCKSQGWSVARTYTDRASGATSNRPELQRALGDARLGHYEVLLVVRVDRLSRNLVQLARIAEQLEEGGAVLVSATEPFDTANPTGRMLFQLLGSFAEFERAMIVDRITAGLERRAKSGRWTAGRIPFGYRRLEAGGELVPDPLAAPLVERIFDLYLSERLGTPAIAKQLNESGERTQGGNPWSGGTVATILRNRAYLGMVPWRGELHPGDHEPLIDRATFEAAQELLEKRAAEPRLRRANTSDYLLSGLVLCGRCGTHYVGTQANGNGGRYEYYACQGRSRHGTSHCDNDYLPRHALEGAVIAQLTTLLLQSDLLKEAWAEAQASQVDVAAKLRAERARIQARRGRLDGKRRRYFQAFEAGTLEPGLCQERLAELSVQAEQLTVEEAELSQQLEAAEAPPVFPQRAVATAQSRLESAEQADPAKTKALLALLVAEISVESRTEIKPMYRVPVDLDEPAVRPMPEKVELAGLEPATSWVRSRRSSS
jgi:site-specific DNA recombinase